MEDQKKEQRSSPDQSCEQENDESSNLSPKKKKNSLPGRGSFKRAFTWKSKTDVASGDHGMKKSPTRKSSHSLLNPFHKVEEEADSSQKSSNGSKTRQKVSSETRWNLEEEEPETDSFLPAKTKDPQQKEQKTPSKPCSPTPSQSGRELSINNTNSYAEKEDDNVLRQAKKTILKMSKREGTAGGQPTEETNFLRRSSRFLRSFRKNEEEMTNQLSRLPKGSQGSYEEETLENMEMEEEKPVSDLIAERQLLKAFSQLSQLEASLVEDQLSGRFKDEPTAYARQAMDICLHYDMMGNEIRSIVEETLSQPSVDSKALPCMAQLIKMEEEVHPVHPNSDFLRAPRKWRHLWEEAVKKSALERMGRVGQGMSEPTLVNLLSDYGRVVKEDLMKIRQEVQPCYPEDFPVWKTYVDAFHAALSARFQELLQKAQGFEQLYVIMDWVTNVYCSNNLLGSLDPALDVTTMPKLLAPEVWEKLESDCTKFLEIKIKNCFDNILKLEQDRWSKREHPTLLQDLYHSDISVDIHTLVGEHVNTTRAISLGLEATTLQILEQSLNDFIPRFEKRLLDSDTTKDQTLFLPYLCAYINAFQELQTNLPVKFLNSFKNVGTTLLDVISRFKKQMLLHLHRETQVLSKEIGSKTWLTSDKLQPIMEKTITFAQHLKHLVQPHSQECLHETHCYVIREYVAHVLRPQERLRGANRVASAQKMSQESDAIASTFHSLGSEASWLHLVIPCISDILGETYKDDISKHIEALIMGYPDIRQEHVAAILALRKLGRRRNQLLLRHAQLLLKKAPKISPGQALFEEIDVPASVEVLLTCI